MKTANKYWVSKAELERHGVVVTTVEVFSWGGYRYTNAHDAIAAARRADSQ